MFVINGLQLAETSLRETRFAHLYVCMYKYVEKSYIASVTIPFFYSRYEGA